MDVEDFPVEAYNDNIAKYAESEAWFDGTRLEDADSRNGKSVELYPVRVNPIRGAVFKHAAVLFGEIVDDGRPLVVPRLLPRSGDEQEKAYAKEAEEALNMLWYENHGRELQMRNGIQSQIFGGSVFKLTYVPHETWRTIPIRIEIVPSKRFVGIPDASDYWRLARAWTIQTVDPVVARSFGYIGDLEDGAGLYLVEDWRRNYYKTTVNDQLASKDVGGDQRKDLAGVNPFGFVPIVYIPHLRTTSFYGDNIIDSLRGIVKELNLRIGDYGDAVSDDAHSWLGMRNVSGTPRVVEIAPGLKVVNLGNVASVTGHESSPDIFSLKGQTASTSMGNLIDSLYAQFRRDACLPAVSDGEDEGSQRSASTLAFRMWPLASHINQERVMWTTGLNWLSSMALRMMASPNVARKMKAKGFAEIKDEHLRMRIKQDWAPMFPRDREATINELSLRAAANIGSIDHLLELAGDVEDVEGEKKKILAWLKELAELEPMPTHDMNDENDNQLEKKSKDDNK